jgi:hypothetical protein
MPCGDRATPKIAGSGPAAAAVVEVISQPTLSWFATQDLFMQTSTPTQSGYITEVAIGTDYEPGTGGSLVIYDGAGPGTVEEEPVCRRRIRDVRRPGRQ